MRTLSGVVASVLVLNVSLVLCGCASTQSPLPIATPAERPSSAGEAEMVAEARRTYESYLKISAEVLADGGSGVERLKSVVTSAELQRERTSAMSLEDEHLRGEGEAQLLKFKVQHFDSEKSTLTTYSCVDLSAVRILNRSRKDVTPTDRPDLQTSLSTFVVEGGSVKLEEDAEWDGSSIC